MIAWHRAGDNPLSEPMMAYLTDAHMRHFADGLTECHMTMFRQIQTVITICIYRRLVI